MRYSTLLPGQSNGIRPAFSRGMPETTIQRIREIYPRTPFGPTRLKDGTFVRETTYENLTDIGRELGNIIPPVEPFPRNITGKWPNTEQRPPGQELPTRVIQEGILPKNLPYNPIRNLPDPTAGRSIMPPRGVPSDAVIPVPPTQPSARIQDGPGPSRPMAPQRRVPVPVLPGGAPL